MTIHSTDPTMSETPTIGYDRFPRQGAYKNSRVRVCFDYDADRSIDGTVVRDDAEMPGLLIIRLDDGRTVLSGECMFRRYSDG